MEVALLTLALLGHTILWVALINRTHAVGLSRATMKVLTLVGFAAMGILPLAYAWWRWGGAQGLEGAPWQAIVRGAGGMYLGLCLVVAVAGISWWGRSVLLHRPPGLHRFHRIRSIDLRPNGDALTSEESEEHQHHFLVHLPGNEILRLDLTEHFLEVPRLAPALDGLTLVHLSDFHFTGLVGKAYFREVVRLSNALDPDLVAITGDLVDRPAYLEWVPELLGGFKARYGVYFVLGNHDRRVGPQRLRHALGQAGLVDLGGQWLEIAIRGQPVILAGNELPWFGPAADLAQCPLRADRGRPLRIALTHSPDQLAWARTHDVDLLLAGHTHGGQICVPLIGAIFSPSWTGVRYVSGVFHESPTILHVSRGVSGELPVRLNCPPEMTRLVLHAPSL